MIFTCIWDSSPSICSKDSPIHNNHSTSSLLQPENYSKNIVSKFYKQSTKTNISIFYNYKEIWTKPNTYSKDPNISTYTLIYFPKKVHPIQPY